MSLPGDSDTFTLCDISEWGCCLPVEGVRSRGKTNPGGGRVDDLTNKYMDRRTIQIRIEREIHKKLKYESIERETTISNLATQIIDSYFKTLDK